LVRTTREKSLGNGVAAQNGSKPCHNRLIWQGKVGKSTGSSRFNAWERWNRLTNPIKHKANENFEFQSSVENIEIIPSQKQRVH